MSDLIASIRTNKRMMRRRMREVLNPKMMRVKKKQVSRLASLRGSTSSSKRKKLRVLPLKTHLMIVRTKVPSLIARMNSHRSISIARVYAERSRRRREWTM